MEAKKCTAIKDLTQYQAYCCRLELLLESVVGSEQQEEVDLITSLIEQYDSINTQFKARDPIALVKSFMHDHDLDAQELSKISGASEDDILKILNYRKPMSQTLCKALSKYFKVSEQAFDRPYKLVQ